MPTILMASSKNPMEAPTLQSSRVSHWAENPIQGVKLAVRPSSQDCLCDKELERGETPIANNRHQLIEVSIAGAKKQTIIGTQKTKTIQQGQPTVK